MKNKKTLGIFSLILPILSFIVLVGVTAYGLDSGNALKIAMYGALVALIINIVAIILGIVGMKNAKGLSIVGIVLGCIGAYLCFSNISLDALVPKFNDCEKIDEKTSKCKYNGVEIEIPNQFLEENQYKKEG